MSSEFGKSLSLSELPIDGLSHPLCHQPALNSNLADSANPDNAGVFGVIKLATNRKVQERQEYKSGGGRQLRREAETLRGIREGPPQDLEQHVGEKHSAYHQRGRRYLVRRNVTSAADQVRGQKRYKFHKCYFKKFPFVILV